MQWNLNYDPTVISNITLDNFGLDNLSAASFAVTPGTIALSWTALDLVNGSTVPDGTVIFEICYDCGNSCSLKGTFVTYLEAIRKSNLLNRIS